MLNIPHVPIQDARSQHDKPTEEIGRGLSRGSWLAVGPPCLLAALPRKFCLPSLHVDCQGHVVISDGSSHDRPFNNEGTHLGGRKVALPVHHVESCLSQLV